MDTVYIENSDEESSSGCESGGEEYRFTHDHSEESSNLNAYQHAVKRLPRQKGHHKLKVRHLVAPDASPGKTAYLGKHWDVQYAALERSTRSETLAAIKEAIEKEVRSQVEKESQTLILATRCLSSVHEELRESALKLPNMEPGRSSCCLTR
ncbi:uncharacterized protein LOC135462912 [Liolophura sinensis]|uniref:uncharacterized protein LOC135462912 n=1 Tax=Liolophura sinensis TaxID=3198878 RepID=UPI0031581D66